MSHNPRWVRLSRGGGEGGGVYTVGVGCPPCPRYSLLSETHGCYPTGLTAGDEGTTRGGARRPRGLQDDEGARGASWRERSDGPWINGRRAH